MNSVKLFYCPLCIRCIAAKTVSPTEVLHVVSDLKAEYTKKKIKIPNELYRRGCVQTWEEALVSAQKIGFPVMIKASEGGGGKGIRKVDGPEDFANYFRQVCELSLSNFLRIVDTAWLT